MHKDTGLCQAASEAKSLAPGTHPEVAKIIEKTQGLPDSVRARELYNFIRTATFTAFAVGTGAISELTTKVAS